MTVIIPIQKVGRSDRSAVGGKAFALSQLLTKGMDVPKSVCITTEAYNRYISTTGLRERILLELSRKQLDQMRWEEMWDASLRIRNMFLRTPIPRNLGDTISSAVGGCFGGQAVVVRSSAPEEDSAKTSFAGLHESYLNLSGLDRVLTHIRLVWASLWSDAALLYRTELGLDVEKSTMAVLVQEIVIGDRSGVIFGLNPNHSEQAVLESVYGLNAGLVDGAVEPDRWIFERKSGRILDHYEPPRKQWLVPSSSGTSLEALPNKLRRKPPLDDTECTRLYRMAMKLESYLGSPQDVEWTLRDGVLYLLQSRPITTAPSEAAEDKRPWYLSLRRSLDNLKSLHLKIEKQLLPKMLEEAVRLRERNMAGLSDDELADEIALRKKTYDHWVDVYWKEFIPFAHGMRLFGQVYNDALKPDDPFEFMDLLRSANLASIQRNKLLVQIAQKLHGSPELIDCLKRGDLSLNPEFEAMLNAFIEQLGIGRRPAEGAVVSGYDKNAIIPLLLELASSPEDRMHSDGKDPEILNSRFLACFDGDKKQMAQDLLDLGRASYRLRDDDNIYLGRIEMEMSIAVSEGIKRIEKRGTKADIVSAPEDVIEVLKNPAYIPQPGSSEEKAETGRTVKARQLLGQPAGPGIARGAARVILKQSDLFEFKRGETLVCDALDPNMTFVVPLSAGIVERRGGMLIHGAIIAREYGIPCVTGVAEAASLIQTGQTVTVDGYLGIVTIE